MTEDDTFNALKKATFEQMKEEFVRLKIYFNGDYTNPEWHEARIFSAERMGWTVKEYQKENSRRINSLK